MLSLGEVILSMQTYLLLYRKASHFFYCSLLEKTASLSTGQKKMLIKYFGFFFLLVKFLFNIV